MALTPEERRVLSRNIITWSEYQEVILGTVYDKDERDEIDAHQEEWFNKWQVRALRMLRKVVPQSHLIPRTRRDYLDLKQDFWIEEGTNIYHTEPLNFQEEFKSALAWQINYMHDNEAWFENGWINAAGAGFTVGGYTHAGQHFGDMHKIFNDLAPQAYDALENMGWMYACINNPLPIRDFYKEERN